MFAAVEGTPKQKLLTVLRQIDDRFDSSSRTLTTTQAEFLRSMTLFAYTEGITSALSLEDFDWLMTRFRSEPTPQRALMLALLVRFDELPSDSKPAILAVLAGTQGERFLDPGVIPDSETK